MTTTSMPPSPLPEDPDAERSTDPVDSATADREASYGNEPAVTQETAGESETSIEADRVAHRPDSAD